MEHPLSPPAALTEEAVSRVIVFFETLSPAGVSQLGELYAADARFKDPFNEVQGVPAIQGIFSHMFDTLEQPRFVVTGRVVQGQQCFLTWEFRFAFRSYAQGVEQTIRGATHLVLDDAQRITLHRDYWDAAEELYEKLPGLRVLMRWLKKRASQ